MGVGHVESGTIDEYLLLVGEYLQYLHISTLVYRVLPSITTRILLLP